MTRIISILIICLPIYIIAQAPVVDFQSTYGGSNNDFGQTFINTLDDGYLLAGYSYSYDGDVTLNYGEGDIWLTKVNSSGVTEWNKNYGGSQNDNVGQIIKNTNGSYVFVGSTSSNNFDIASPRGYYDGWLVQISSSGIIEWKKNLGGDDFDSLLDVIRTSDGGLLAVGSTNSNNGQISGNHGSRDAWVIKLDTNGNLEWSKCFGGTEVDSFNKVVELQDGNFVIAGISYSTNGDVTNPKGDRDMWIVKINTLGDLIWQKSYGGSAFDSAHNIIELDNGNLIIAGGSASSDGDTAINSNNTDFWVFKTDAIGTIIWERKFGGSEDESIGAMMKTSDNGCIISGQVFSSSGAPSASFGLSDVGLIRLDVNGNTIWTTNVGGFSIDETRKMLMNNNKLVIFGYKAVSDNNFNYWLLQFQSQSLSTIDLIAKSFIISPNPTTKFIQISNLNAIKIDKVSLIDMLGKQVILSADNTEYIDVSHLQNASYILKIESESISYYFKIVKK